MLPYHRRIIGNIVMRLYGTIVQGISLGGFQYSEKVSYVTNAAANIQYKGQAAHDGRSTYIKQPPSGDIALLFPAASEV